MNKSYKVVIKYKDGSKWVVLESASNKESALKKVKDTIMQMIGFKWCVKSEIVYESVVLVK